MFLNWQPHLEKIIIIIITTKSNRTPSLAQVVLESWLFKFNRNGNFLEGLSAVIMEILGSCET